MRNNIAFITHSQYPVEPRARRMAEAIADVGHHVDVYCLRGQGEPDNERLNGVAIHRLPVTRHQGRGRLVYALEYLQFLLLTSWRMTLQHRRAPYALVQVYNPPDVLVFSTLLPRLFSKMRVVLDVRDMAPELFMSRFNLARHHPITRTLRRHERWACAYADAVTVCTVHQYNVMAGRGISEPKMVIVMNTPDDIIFGAPQPLRPARHVPGGPFTLIYHGGILARYGVDVLLRAVPHLLADIADLRVEVYGTGDFQTEAQTLARSLGLDAVVRFHGRLALEAIPAAIAASDLGVVPNRCDMFTNTILPTKLMEYAHMGIPAVVARTRTAEEYFDDTMVAYFQPEDSADLAEQVLALYRNPARAETLAANARRFTANYNWARDKAAYMALINRLIGART